MKSSDDYEGPKDFNKTQKYFTGNRNSTQDEYGYQIAYPT